MHDIPCMPPNLPPPPSAKNDDNGPTSLPDPAVDVKCWKKACDSNDDAVVGVAAPTIQGWDNNLIIDMGLFEDFIDEDDNIFVLSFQ